MAKITYHTHDNKTHTIDVQNGLSVMEGAVQNDIPGIDADCGGGMACATCHVYVNEEWLDKLPEKEDGEEDMLDMALLRPPMCQSYLPIGVSYSFQS